MIIKVIPNTIGSSVEERVTGLSDYIHHPKQTRAQHLSDYIHQLHPNFDQDLLSEKCVYSNSRNFLDDDPYYQKIEMSQTASLNSRVIDPIVHIVGSFKKFEVPTTEQLEEQIDILAKHLGAEELQMQYAMHMDTDNVHFHLIVNKVHPFKKNKHNENKVIDLGEGWILNAVHRAAAEIEAKQGWEPEPNPMFIYNHDTGQCEKNPDYIPQPDAEKIDSKIRDQEHRHQQKSRMSHEIDQGKDYLFDIEKCVKQTLNHAENWESWHQQLAQHGILYEKKRSGSIFKIQTSEKQTLTFKASLFCNKQVTLKNLEKQWGDFTHHDVDHKIIPLIKLSDTVQHAQSAETTVHSYHLFKNEDFLVKDLHDIYLEMKSEKDSISTKRRDEYLEVSFENEIYKHNKQHFLKNLQQQFPEQSSDVIFTLLHYQHHADQMNSRALQRKNYNAQHANLSQNTSQTLQKNVPFSSSVDSSKITSYADFLKHIPLLNHLRMQQQFLFDQRQSKNFIRQYNPNIKTARILFDQHQPNEPIAIQNQYGVLVFSNYSSARLQQCIKALGVSEKAFLHGSSEFKALCYTTLSDLKENKNIVDTNQERVLPSFTKLSQQEIESCFTFLFEQFRSTSNVQSTALIKTCLLLNCCGVHMNQLQSILRNCVDQNDIPDLSVENQTILLQRVRNLVYTQPIKLNKQYFNSTEIEQTWQLYFSLQTAPPILDEKQKYRSETVCSIPIPELTLIPKNEANKTFQHAENLPELDFLQMQQYFEYSRRIQLKKKQEAELLNTFKSEKQISMPSQQNRKMCFPREKYTVEFKFGQKFYLDQKKIAFFETKNTSEIAVVSHQHEHVRDALFLARDKFGVVLVDGTDEFKRQVQEIAHKENIKIKFDTPPQQRVNASIENSPVGDSAAKNDRTEPKSPTKELNLEPKDPNIVNNEEKADNFYNNQSVAASRSRKESTPEDSYDYGPDF